MCCYGLGRLNHEGIIMIDGLLLYQHILITLALFIFIVNQANVLYDTFHIALIRRRVVKKFKDNHSPGIEQAAEIRAKEITKWDRPTWDFPFCWWWLPVGILISLIIMAAGYIFFGYDPNPTR